MVKDHVVVFGASGFIGRNLVAALRSAGVVVLQPTNATGGRLDIAGRVEQTEAAIANARVVVNAAGTAHSHSTNPATFWPANTLGARNIARAVAASPSVERLVHVSSVAVGAGGLEPAAADFYPFTAYGAAKAAGELAVAAELALAQAELVVVRPAGIGGHGSPGAWGRIWDLTAARRLVPVPDSDVRYNVVEIDQVVDFLASAVSGGVLPGVHSLPGPHSVTIAEYVEKVGKIIGVEPRTVRVPHWALGALLTSTTATERATRPVGRVRQVLTTLINQRPLVVEPWDDPRRG